MDSKTCEWCGVTYHRPDGMRPEKFAKSKGCCLSHAAKIGSKGRSERLAAEKFAKAAAKDAIWNTVVFPSFDVRPDPRPIPKPPATHVPYLSSATWAAQ